MIVAGLVGSVLVAAVGGAPTRRRTSSPVTPTGGPVARGPVGGYGATPPAPTQYTVPASFRLDRDT
jgi:hypothetical protein